MSTVLVGSYNLGGVNVALNGAVALMVPLLGQVDLMLTGPFGLGAVQADLAAQLNAALAAQFQLTIAVSDPIAALKQQLQALLAVQAGISALLAFGLPPLAVQAQGSLAISAALALKLGGIRLLIQLVLQLKLPLVNLLAGLNLGAGPFVLMSVGFAAPSTLASSVSEYNALVSGGIGGILPGDQVYGVIILTKSPAASAALAGVIRTTP